MLRQAGPERLTDLFQGGGVTPTGGQEHLRGEQIQSRWPGLESGPLPCVDLEARTVSVIRIAAR